jgi:glycine dehydrogenase subunit 2
MLNFSKTSAKMNKTFYQSLIFEHSIKDRTGVLLDDSRDCDIDLPRELRREKRPELPEVDELSVVRHYTNLSNNNFGVDTGMYPLGSCTMKYNPKINEEFAANPAIASLHPMQPAWSVQGALHYYWTLQSLLSKIGGMAEFTLNPYAGAHGELTGLMVIHAYHDSRGDAKRRKVLIPDSAHGTNPASAAVCGYEVVEVKSLADGTVDIDDLAAKLDDSVAAMMMTNPNTTGMFESHVERITAMVHDAGGLMYYDGANLNALLGVTNPGLMGFDVMHINLHKTFSTPHGGGGPGSGPVGVRAGLEQFLPNPRVIRTVNDGKTSYDVVTDCPEALGRVSAWLGNYTVELKALAYILTMGDQLYKVGALATLNANYIKDRLKDLYELPIQGRCKHEFVFDGLRDKSTGVTTLNIAKRLLDYGFHAPTIYFPLLFHEALMIEPTETENLQTLDSFIDVMRAIAIEAIEQPDNVLNAPLTTPVSRPDDAQAALDTRLTWRQLNEKPL